MAHWSDMLDERAKKELLFAEKYVTEFNHGAMGHMVMNLVVALKRELDRLYALLEAQGVDASPASDNAPSPVQNSGPGQASNGGGTSEGGGDNPPPVAQPSSDPVGDGATSESADTPADSATPGA